ncbi:STAS-like domain-containing protein [Cobetia amphilecti]|nr:STAS-like domain-containing protein [Cobetia litoralis]
MIINIAKEFSPFPAGRFLTDGPYSGEKFREEFLIPNIERHEELLINLDGVMGFGSSFLEEAFGGLVRRLDNSSVVFKKIKFISNEDPFLIDEINSYMEGAKG